MTFNNLIDILSSFDKPMLAYKHPNLHEEEQNNDEEQIKNNIKDLIELLIEANEEAINELNKLDISVDNPIYGATYEEIINSKTSESSFVPIILISENSSKLHKEITINSDGADLSNIYFFDSTIDFAQKSAGTKKKGTSKKPSRRDEITGGNWLNVDHDTWGTAGVFYTVRGKSTTTYGLSCSHVLNPKGLTQLPLNQDTLYAKSYLNQGTNISNRIDSHLITSISLNKSEVDCARALINDYDQFVTAGHVKNIQVTFNLSSNRPSAGDNINIYGAASNSTTGQIITINGWAKIEFNGEFIEFENQVIASNNNERIVEPGDSGSLILDTNDNVLGLVMATNTSNMIPRLGNRRGTQLIKSPYHLAIANRFDKVSSALGGITLP